MSTLSAVARNISWNYLDAAVNLLVYLLLTPVVVAQLGATGFGMWVLINAILYYLRFLDLGFNTALVKYIAELTERGAWRRVNSLIGATISMLLLAGVMAQVLSVLVALWIVPHFFNLSPQHVWEFQVAVVLLGAQLLLGFPLSVFDAIYEGRQRFDVLSGVGAVCRVISAVAILACLSHGYGVIALVLVQIFATLLQAAIFFSLLHRLVPQVRLRLRPMVGWRYRQLRAYSGWSALNELITEGSSELEKLLIPFLLSVSLVTPYTLVCAVAAVIFLAIEPITDTFFPLSSAYDAKNDKQRLRHLLRRGSQLVMAISLPLAVVVIAYGEAFIGIWIGEEHVVVPDGVLPLVVVSFTITAFVITSGTILLALAKVRQVFWMTASELVLVLVLVLLLTPGGGLAGFAGALLIANGVLAFLWTIPYICWLLEESLFGYLWRSLLRPLLAAVPALLAAAVLDRLLGSDSLLPLVVKSAGVGGTFVMVFWVVSLSPAERRLVADRGQQLWLRISGRGQGQQPAASTPPSADRPL
ncbi:MAG: oligosaccharide flippase family protein [Gammaproteobacteria bacterium]